MLHSYIEGFLLISGDFGFSFFAIEHIFENTRTTENHENLVFFELLRLFMLFTPLFLRILGVHGTVHKVLIKARTFLNVLAQSYQREPSNKA